MSCKLSHLVFKFELLENVINFFQKKKKINCGRQFEKETSKLFGASFFFFLALYYLSLTEDINIVQ